MRPRLDWRKVTGILEEAIPEERKREMSFGTKEASLPFQRKGNCLHTKCRNEKIHSDPRERRERCARSLHKTKEKKESTQNQGKSLSLALLLVTLANHGLAVRSCRPPRILTSPAARANADTGACRGCSHSLGCSVSRAATVCARIATARALGRPRCSRARSSTPLALKLP